MDARIERFVSLYNEIDKHNLDKLQQIYSSDIEFVDPMHRIDGLEQLTEYFKKLYENVGSVTFAVDRSYSADEMSFLYWTMRFRHPKLNGGKEVSVDGHSVLQFRQDYVVHHRDYFDTAQMLYRHIPVLGTLVKFVEKRAAS
ncbi:nuclear transport factor 2 family protein (plasmid) [Pseudoalteromonas sp. T1lg65]|uniref:nuclear transport factor 2 family protein n=1 Tax=Pseudoalteromonas sp. T1lg65 TaxID=2077101 RepID=UPI003F7A5AD4